MLFWFFCFLLFFIAYSFVFKHIGKRQFLWSLFLPLLASIFYLMLGEPNFDNKKQAWQSLIENAQEIVNQQPDNIDAWRAMAKIYDLIGLSKKHNEALQQIKKLEEKLEENNE